jgi:hypothetical protein
MHLGVSPNISTESDRSDFRNPPKNWIRREPNFPRRPNLIPQLAVEPGARRTPASLPACSVLSSTTAQATTSRARHSQGTCRACQGAAADRCTNAVPPLQKSKAQRRMDDAIPRTHGMRSLGHNIDQRPTTEGSSKTLVINCGIIQFFVPVGLATHAQGGSGSTNASGKKVPAQGRILLSSAPGGGADPWASSPGFSGSGEEHPALVANEKRTPSSIEGEGCEREARDELVRVFFEDELIPHPVTLKLASESNTIKNADTYMHRYRYCSKR